jgi:hypothetical protein
LLATYYELSGDIAEPSKQPGSSKKCMASTIVRGKYKMMVLKCQGKYLYGKPREVNGQSVLCSMGWVQQMASAVYLLAVI